MISTIYNFIDNNSFEETLTSLWFIIYNIYIMKLTSMVQIQTKVGEIWIIQHCQEKTSQRPVCFLTPLPVQGLPRYLFVDAGVDLAENLNRTESAQRYKEILPYLLLSVIVRWLSKPMPSLQNCWSHNCYSTPRTRPSRWWPWDTEELWARSSTSTVWSLWPTPIWEVLVDCQNLIFLPTSMRPWLTWTCSIMTSTSSNKMENGTSRLQAIPNFPWRPDSTKGIGSRRRMPICDLKSNVMTFMNISQMITKVFVLYPSANNLCWALRYNSI